MKLIEAFQEIANNKEVHFSTKLRGSELTVNYSGVDDFSTISGSMLSIGDIIRCLNQEIPCVKIIPNDDEPKTFNQIREESGLPRVEDADDPYLTELQSIHKILKELKDNLLGESDD